MKTVGSFQGHSTSIASHTRLGYLAEKRVQGCERVKRDIKGGECPVPRFSFLPTSFIEVGETRDFRDTTVVFEMPGSLGSIVYCV